MSKAVDTSLEVQRLLTEIYREMLPIRKWELIGTMYGTGRMLHAAGVRLRQPNATQQDIQQEWLRQVATTRAFSVADVPMQTSNENLRVLRAVTGALEQLGIAYAVGGSLASSVHGIPRFTLDADLTAEPFPDKEAELVKWLGPEFYASEAAIAQANRDRSSFNLIHPSSGFKVDIFIRKDRPFEQSLMQRRLATPLPDNPLQPVMTVSPEDIILLKLEWYRLGNQTSDRQWQDILGVLQTQTGKLDEAYLHQWAKDLGVHDLLAKAQTEAAS